MFEFKLVALNGIELDGSSSINPLLRNFFESKGVQIKQENGYITLTGEFTITKEEMKHELASLFSKAYSKSVNSEISTQHWYDLHWSNIWNYVLTPFYIEEESTYSYNYGIKTNYRADITNTMIHNYGIYMFHNADIYTTELHNNGVFITTNGNINADLIKNSDPPKQLYLYNEYRENWERDNEKILMSLVGSLLLYAAFKLSRKCFTNARNLRYI